MALDESGWRKLGYSLFTAQRNAQMATPRKLDAALQLTPYFHCTSRCVRGAFLCGVNKSTGEDYSHRRKWLRYRLLQLADIFAIKIAAFAIMENHFHVVLQVNREIAQAWTDSEVILRWHRLFKGNNLSQRHVNSEFLNAADSKALSMCVQRWRTALYDISWFMRCAKEPLARRSNREDDCKGRFWEGRFHSQALLDSRAVIACMAYVDLNPLRARQCKLPEKNSFTSLFYRAKAVSNDAGATAGLPTSLINLDFPSGNERNTHLALSTAEYIELVDLVARQTRPGKKGVLSELAIPALERLGIKKAAWQELELQFNKHFHVLVGSASSLKNACISLRQKCAWGQRHCHYFFGESPN